MAKISCQILAFSGRPDPRWQLTSEQAASFRKVFDALEQNGNWQEPSGQLGYRGCLIELEGKEWFTYDGHVSSLSDSRISYQDPFRSLEKFILQSAPLKWSSLVSGIIDTELK